MFVTSLTKVTLDMLIDIFMFVTTFEMIFFFESDIEHQKCDEHSF